MTTERLPLFPLDTVLMPGMVLPLRIFEPRYLLMMEHILAGRRRFGVLLARRAARGGAAEPYEVGTVAEVMDVVAVAGSLVNISTTGRERFRVQALHHDLPYLTGDVDYLSEEYQPSEGLLELQVEVEDLSVQYVTTVLALTNEQTAQVRLPHDPVALSYKVAGLLVAIQAAEAQALLASAGVEHRLYAELLLLRRELTILRRMGEMRHSGERSSPN